MFLVLKRIMLDRSQTNVCFISRIGVSTGDDGGSSSSSPSETRSKDARK